MKKRTIKFQLELEVVYDDRLDDDWVADRYLFGPRFSIEGFESEPGTVVCTYAGISE